ncbi:TlpA family protein disulfide reductase [Bowmanella yangjiangensis]|uniref:Thioredoxin family protein n=1 Tax=Bowmanella yangjiangensis TaxID=2811230 RepID=A0ABS3CQL6_9ALTE|nr:thioredoxin family protein [Bowmanella yangjiangensis]MBN7819387.1 thioredoxin family protein [Bowmanella yangjiangensis]
MKVQFIAPLLLVLSGCVISGQDTASQPLNTSTPPVENPAPTSRSELLADPDFRAEYQAYNPSRDELRKMAALRGKGVLVFYGSWCHDSKREVPRLLKLLDESQVNPAWLQLVPVDRDKQEPTGLYKQYKLRYTPTIIVLDQGVETHRMVERPKRSMASDLTGL